MARFHTETPIEHLIVVIPENRSYDHTFGTYRPRHGQLVRLIEEGISAGEFRRVDARNAAVTVTSIMVHYFATAPVLRIVLGHDPLRPREVAKRREAVQDFLKHGLFRLGAGAR